MDELFKQILSTGGPLGVLVAVVWIFLDFQKQNSREHRAWMDATMATGQAMMAKQHEEHLKERELARGVIERNTVALERNTASLVKGKGE